MILMGRRRVLNGTIPQGSQTLPNTGQPQSVPIRVRCDTKVLTKNWEVVSFKIFPNMSFFNGQGAFNETIHNNYLTYIILALDRDGAETSGSFANYNQIGFAVVNGSNSVMNHYSTVDFDHVVIEDMHIGVYAVDTSQGGIHLTSLDLNYEIVLEEKKTDAETAIMAMTNVRQ